MPSDSAIAAQAVDRAEMVNSTGSAGVAQKEWAFRVESMTPVYTMMPKPAIPAIVANTGVPPPNTEAMAPRKPQSSGSTSR